MRVCIIMCFDICTINIRVSIRVRGLHLVFWSRSACTMCSIVVLVVVAAGAESFLPGCMLENVWNLLSFLEEGLPAILLGSRYFQALHYVWCTAVFILFCRRCFERISDRITIPQSEAQRQLALRAILAPFSPSRFFAASEHSDHLRQSQTAQEEKGEFVSLRSNSVTCRACSPGRFSSLVVDKDGDTAECRSMAAIFVASWEGQRRNARNGPSL